jgi:16S rRNA (cytosine1402-N4)-methyltransferase
MTATPFPKRDPVPSVHVPVLVREVLQCLDLRPDSIVVDATFGGGGHASHLLQALGPNGMLIGLDRDPSAIQSASERFTDPRVNLFCRSYVELPAALQEAGVTRCDAVLVDLGLSSDQLADASRGFGIQTGGPLDLRFNAQQGESAADLLAKASEAELTQIFREYGEEPKAALIARKIVETRAAMPINTTDDLARLISQVTPPGRGIHPATLVIQALRIAVNRELDAVQTLVSDVLPAGLKPGGRVAIISFHSLEDRIVKQAFRNRDVWDEITKKPITASPKEVRLNPRSRSAKLRSAALK